MKSGRNNRQVRAAVLNNPLVMVSSGLLVLAVLLAGAVLSDAEISGAARHGSPAAVDVEPVEASDTELTHAAGKEVETLTMEIPIQKGGTVDLKLHSQDVTIEKYAGEYVLLIIESSKPADLARSGGKNADPIDIQITRNGHNVQIESVKGGGSTGPSVDISFKIMVPSQSQALLHNSTHGKVIQTLLSAMQRTLTRETLKWLM